MWKPQSRLLGDALAKFPVKARPTYEKTDSDYYKITQHILDNLEMHPDYEPPISVTKTGEATHRVNIYTIDQKKIKRLWKSYWVEIKEGVMTFNPNLETKVS